MEETDKDVGPLEGVVDRPLPTASDFVLHKFKDRSKSKKGPRGFSHRLANKARRQATKANRPRSSGHKLTRKEKRHK